MGTAVVGFAELRERFRASEPIAVMEVGNEDSVVSGVM